MAPNPSLARAIPGRSRHPELVYMVGMQDTKKVQPALDSFCPLFFLVRFLGLLSVPFSLKTSTCKSILMGTSLRPHTHTHTHTHTFTKAGVGMRFWIWVRVGLKVGQQQ